MNTDPVLAKSIDINAAADSVWDTLTNPVKISEFFTGAETITDWQPGSEILFIHEYEGQQFINRGIVLNFEVDRLLRYSYWTAFSKTEDLPENYTVITYTIIETAGCTNLQLTQTNFRNLEWYQALENGWNMVLDKIKEISER